MKKITIAIDGHSSCGKSTMAKDLARRIGYVYIDTGAMYRAVTLYAMRRGLISNGHVLAGKLEKELDSIHISFRLDNDTKCPNTYLNGICVEREIRSMEVSRLVSMIAALPFVRVAMVEAQREMGKEKGVVMDGRDIGTVVFPGAELKVFVTASPEVRAQRRYDELKAKGEKCQYGEILENVRQRDFIDSTRETSPLRQAKDAIVLDNTHMTIPEQEEWLMEKFREKAAAE